MEEDEYKTDGYLCLLNQCLTEAAVSLSMVDDAAYNHCEVQLGVSCSDLMDLAKILYKDRLNGLRLLHPCSSIDKQLVRRNTIEGVMKMLERLTS